MDTATHGSMCRGRSAQVCMGYTSTTCEIYLEPGILINTIANIQLIHIECVDNPHLDTFHQHIKCITANTQQLCIIQAYTYNTQTKTCQIHRTCTSDFSLIHMNPNCYYSSPQPFLLLPKLPCPNLTPDCPSRLPRNPNARTPPRAEYHADMGRCGRLRCLDGQLLET